MTKLLVGLFVLGAALFAGGCGGSSVGVVDTQRVLNESVKGLQLQKQLDDREKQMVAELAAIAPQVSKTDLSARRARYLTELGQIRRDYEAQLTQQLSQIVGEVAREDHLRVVLVKAPVWIGGRDITQQIIDRLK
jgi:Skp family chaperone for outer membrane proteins